MERKELNEEQRKACFNEIKNWLESQGSDYIISLHNYRCDTSFCREYRVYEMNELDDVLSDCTPTDIFDMAERCDFNTADDYFTYDGSEIKSGWLDTFVDLDEMVNMMVDDDDEYNDDQIRSILDGWYAKANDIDDKIFDDLLVGDFQYICGCRMLNIRNPANGIGVWLSPIFSTYALTDENIGDYTNKELIGMFLKDCLYCSDTVGTFLYETAIKGKSAIISPSSVSSEWLDKAIKYFDMLNQNYKALFVLFGCGSWLELENIYNRSTKLVVD